MGSSEPTEIYVEIKVMSAAAMLATDGDIEAWVPFSLLQDDSELTCDSTVGTQGLITIPLWKAEQIGWV
jgi:hypothetical protein